MITENDPHLMTLDEETLEPPTSRVGSAVAIRSRIATMRHDDRTRSARRSVMQAIYDGVAPYSKSKLIAKGQADRTNVNWREAEGMVDAAKTPYYSLKFRQARFATIRCVYGDNPQLHERWSEIISDEFHCMLDQWNGHDFNTQLMQWQMCFFGIGLPMFIDSRSPLWEARKIDEVLVPDQSLADIEQLEEAACPRRISPVKLYQMVKNAGAAKAAGWFPERVKRALVARAPESMATNWGEVWNERYESSLRRGDTSWNDKSAMIGIADYLVKEFSGKITHCILLDDGAPGTKAEKEDDGLLFRKEERFECFSQVLCPFFFDVGPTGEWHGIKGLGPKIRDFCEVSNRLICGNIDGARVGSRQLLQAKTAEAMQTTQLIEINGAHVIPPGFDVVNNRIAESLQGPLAVMRDMQNRMQNNTGQYLQRGSAENAEPTLGQAQLNQRNEATLTESSIDRYVKTDDRLLTEQARRALKLGLELYDRKKMRDLTPGETYSKPGLTEGERLSLGFVHRCVNKGVPMEALDWDYIESVKATRGIGSGSPAAVDMATQQLMAMLPLYDERGRNAVIRMRTAHLVGQGNVDEIVRPLDDRQLPGRDEQQATDENNALRNENGQTKVAYTDDHLIHFDVAMADMMMHVQELQAQQAAPMEVLIHLHLGGVHTKAHLNGLAGDPTRKDQLAQRQDAWLKISKLTDQLQQQTMEAIKSQQANQPPQQPQMDPDLVKGLAKVHGDLQIKQMKTQGDMQLKADKQKAQMRMTDLKTAHDMRLKNIQAGQQQAATQNDMHMKSLITEHDMRIKAAQASEPAPQEKA